MNPTHLLSMPVPLRRAAFVLLLLFVILPIACLELVTWRPKQFYKRYDQLEFGMTDTEVVQPFARAPDCICHFEENRIFYYCRDAITDRRPTQRTAIVNDQKTIPDLYACAQLLFDSESKLSAFTINGEEGHIYTRDGTFPGSRLQWLDPAVFENSVYQLDPRNCGIIK